MLPRMPLNRQTVVSESFIDLQVSISLSGALEGHGWLIEASTSGYQLAARLYAQPEVELSELVMLHGDRLE